MKNKKSYSMSDKKVFKDYPFKECNFSIIALRLLKDRNEKNITKILKDEWYLFNDWYKLNETQDQLVCNKDKKLIRNLYGQNISISAVVGKNGSGKSSLMGIIYRLLNNLSYLITIGLERNAAEPLYYVKGVFATLYFESEGKLGSITCQDSDMQFNWGKETILMSYEWRNDNISEGELEYNRQFIARHFCYTLVENYALFSLTSDEFGRDNAERNPAKALQKKRFKDENYCIKYAQGEWLDSLYKKNDGYQACIGLEPYKWQCVLDINNQRELAIERTTALFLDAGKEPLFDNYCYHGLSLILDKQCASRMVNDSADYKNWTLHPESELEGNFQKNVDTVTSLLLRAYGYNRLNFEDDIVVELGTYIVIKTLTIIQRYDQYVKFRFLGLPKQFARSARTTFNKYKKKWREQYPDLDVPYSSITEAAKDLCSLLRNDTSHVSLKLHQALNMMDAIKAKYEVNQAWICPSISDYKEFKSVIYSDIDWKDVGQILEHLPPSIFSKELYLHKEGQENEELTLNELSSGERQYLQTTSTILYHIRNVISVEGQKGIAKYYNVNLILDELEVCFHPEYQQKFVFLLLSMLEKEKIQNKVNINVILVTHSPFVLSDIPKCNILCLEDGHKKEYALQETFCANIFDLLSGHFFMDNFVGVFSSNYTGDVIEQVYKLCDQKKRKKRKPQGQYKKLRAQVDIIGDEIIKTRLVEMLDEYIKEENELEHLRNRKIILESELKNITERIENYDAH